MLKNCFRIAAIYHKMFGLFNTVERKIIKLQSINQRGRNENGTNSH